MKVLVVGAGVMGFNHVRVLNELKNVSSIVVVDSSEQALARVREKNFEKTILFDSLKQALAENSKIDAAIVAVPTRLHYEIAEQLVDKEIPVLVEKPITDSVVDGKKLVAKAEKKKVILAVGHVERCNPVVQALKKHVSILGALVHASAHRFGVPTDRDVGSSFVDQAVHDIDVISFVSGVYPHAVSAVEKKFVDKKYDDSCAAIFEFDGFTACVEANRVTPIKMRELVIAGTKGTARLDYITQDLTIIKAEHEFVKYSTFDEIVMRVGRGAEFRPYFVKEEPLRVELENFLSAIQNKTKPFSTGEDGLRAVAAIEAGHESAKTGDRKKIIL